jgi:ribonuclease HI
MERPEGLRNGIRSSKQVEGMPIRVFTDGSCTANGQKGAKAGYAAWFPEHPEWSVSARVPDEQEQTNNRGEMSAINAAVNVLEEKGQLEQDIVIYSDSDYCINCLTVWIPGWVNRGWKTAAGKDVQHQDLIKQITGTLSKFKSHRFVHVKAHTGGVDDLSKQNAIVDKMAYEAVTGVKTVVADVPMDVLFEGCPLAIMGPPVSQAQIVDWVRGNLAVLDKDIVDKYLYKIFTDVCKVRNVTLTKQIIAKTPLIRAESGLQIEHVTIDKQ